jgi:hypothetical protein
VATDITHVTITANDGPPRTISGQAFMRLTNRLVSEDERPEVSIPTVEDFKQAATEWIEADDLAALGRFMVRRYERFTPHAHLTIRFVWRATYQEVAGRAQWGDVKRLTQLNGFFADADFAIWLAADWFRGKPQRDIEAGLFRQLAHIGFSDKGKPLVVGPDFAGFVDELTHFGLWQRQYEQLAERIQQLGLRVVE